MHRNLIMPIPMCLVLLSIIIALGIAMMIKRCKKGFFSAKEESRDSFGRGDMVRHDSIAEQVDQTVNPYSTAERLNEMNNRASAGSSAVLPAESEKPFHRNVMSPDEKDTMNSYDQRMRQQDKDETVNPYSRGVMPEDEDETVNPYSRGMVPEDEDETVNPYSRGIMPEDEDETVNPYGWDMKAQDEDETVNPYGWDMKAQNEDETVNPYYAAGNSLVMDEEKTVNPYAQDWMPKLKVGFILEDMQGIREKEMSFSGSMWIGNNAQCELQISISDNHLICVELTYGGGNLYTREISHSGEIVLLNNSQLGDDLVPLKKGSILKIDQTQITIAYIR